MRPGSQDGEKLRLLGRGITKIKKLPYELEK